MGSMGCGVGILADCIGDGAFHGRAGRFSTVCCRCRSRGGCGGSWIGHSYVWRESVAYIVIGAHAEEVLGFVGKIGYGCAGSVNTNAYVLPNIAINVNINAVVWQFHPPIQESKYNIVPQPYIIGGGLRYRVPVECYASCASHSGGRFVRCGRPTYRCRGNGRGDGRRRRGYQTIFFGIIRASCCRDSQSHCIFC